MSVPQLLLEQLQKVESGSIFSGPLPKITSSKGNAYFGKIGSSSEAEQYAGEVESLKAMGIGAPGLVPRVFAFGVQNDRPYFLSEYKDIGTLTEKAAATLGKRLATELHSYKSTRGFGFGIPTYCGATRLQNGWFDTWEGCFSAMMSDLMGQLRKKGRFADVCAKADVVIKEYAMLISISVSTTLTHGRFSILPKLLGKFEIKERSTILTVDKVHW